MHDGTPYGTLTAAGRPIQDAALARLVGESVGDVTLWRTELAENGVYSVDNGVIFSRRMVRDEAIRNARAAGGHLGAEHGQKGAEHGAKGAEHGSKGGRPRTKVPPSGEKETRPSRRVKTPPLQSGETRPPSSPSSSPSSTPSEEGSGLSGRNLSEVVFACADERTNGGAA